MNVIKGDFKKKPRRGEDDYRANVKAIKICSAALIGVLVISYLMDMV